MNLTPPKLSRTTCRCGSSDPVVCECDSLKSTDISIINIALLCELLLEARSADAKRSLTAKLQAEARQYLELRSLVECREFFIKEVPPVRDLQHFRASALEANAELLMQKARAILERDKGVKR